MRGGPERVQPQWTGWCSLPCQWNASPASARGHEGMKRFFVAMSRAWESLDMVEQEFLATQGTAVVLTQVHARARATGRGLDFPILQIVTAKDGCITDVRPFYWDTAAITGRAGVSTSRLACRRSIPGPPAIAKCNLLLAWVSLALMGVRGVDP